MSTAATVFGTYLGIGLVLQAVVFIARKAQRGTKKTNSLFDEGLLATELVLFIALLWPIWIFTSLFRDDESSR